MYAAQLRGAVYRGDTAESSHSETLTPECIAPLAVPARVGLPEIQGVSVRYRAAGLRIGAQHLCRISPKAGSLQPRPGVRGGISMDFAHFDGSIVEPIDIQKNRRII
jgi:hypothetical protein